MVRLVAQRGLQLAEGAGPGKADLVQPAHLIGRHELIVHLHRRVLRPAGDDADDVAGNGRRIVAFEHADPLVALLDVEPAQILITADGVPYALVAQVGGAQVDPLVGKLRVQLQQGHEVIRKGGTPSNRLIADDLLGGNLNDPHVRLSGNQGVVHQNFIQYRRIGVTSMEDAVLICALPQLEGSAVLVVSFLSAHRGIPPWPAASGGRHS